MIKIFCLDNLFSYTALTLGSLISGLFFSKIFPTPSALSRTLPLIKFSNSRE